MATKRFTGAALAEADTKTIAVSGTWGTNDTATLTINGRDLALTVGTDTTTTNIATALKEMINGDTQTGTGDHTFSETGDNVGEFAELSATSSAATVTVTASTKGIPITMTGTVSTASTGDMTITTTNAGTGPADWSNADNWEGAIPTGGTNEIQVVDLASGTASGGTFTLTFDGDTTAAIAYNAAASAVQSALEALDSIGAGNITVSGTDIGTGYTCTFVNDLGGQNVAQMTIDDSSLTGSSPVGQVTTSQAGAAGDDVVIDLDLPIKYGLNQSSVTLNSLTIGGTFGRQNGVIGLPDINRDGTEYTEYRDKYLQISAKNITINTNSSRVKLNAGSVKTTLNVEATGGRDRDGLPSVLFVGTSPYNVINVRGNSSVGVAVLGGETANVADLNVTGNTEVECGTGVTFSAAATVDMNGRTLELNSGVATLNVQGGSAVVEAGAITTMAVSGGAVTYNSTGTLGTVTLSQSGRLDFSEDPRAKTITNPVEMHGPSCFLNDPEQTVASLVVDLNLGATAQQINRGQNYRLTFGATA